MNLLAGSSELKKKIARETPGSNFKYLIHLPPQMWKKITHQIIFQ